MSTGYRKLPQFLKDHSTRNSDVVTHTRIGSSNDKIYGGKYYIPEQSEPEFFRAYYNHVFGQRKNPEYLTEKQLDIGPIAIDLDFRYKEDKRHYKEEHILEFIELLMQCLENMFAVSSDFPIYVCEKPSVNNTGTTIKDGIHLIVGVNLDRRTKTMLQRQLLKGMPQIWDSLREHLVNDDASVLDEGVLKGTTNWQLYGSRKPNHTAYKLTYIYQCRIDEDNYELETAPLEVFLEDLSSKLIQLSVRYHSYEMPELREEHRAEYDSLEPEKRPKKQLKLMDTNDVSIPIDYKRIRTRSDLDRAIERVTGGDNPKDAKKWECKEIHDYTMILPPEFYEAGSYDKWMSAGWALRNSGYHYFPIWVKLSSQSSDFSFTNVMRMHGQWCSWDVKNLAEGKGLTSASIRYWARNHSQDKYERIKKNSLDFYVKQSIQQPEMGTDYDLAKIVHHLFKDDYVCASIKGNIWYEYVGQRWAETDSGQTIRTKLSTEVFDAFKNELTPLRELAKREDELNGTGSEEYAKLTKQIMRTLELSRDLKKANNKKNIMREACDLFYVKNFISLLDSKNHLLCFSNGVIDFEEKQFRQGRHDDYTSKSTNLDYIPIDAARDRKVIGEIEEFWNQLFPVEELRNYMKDHAASLLLGKNNNQTFNIYTGAGRNGKTKFVELMSLALGEYKATVPVSLVTAKRNGIGSLSPEIMQLLGTRYAVMQEPSKGDRINEGVMKELTGGDPIQCRALYKDAVTFYPQFKLAVCTNNLFDIKSNDDGTWRRIRVCKFMSLFTENPVENDARKPYQFKVDKYIDIKFESWKTVFMAQLVDRAFQTMGEVADCPMVMSDSEHYRQDQDIFAEFSRDCIVINESSSLGVDAIHDAFKEWWSRYQSGAPPKGKELFQYITREYGAKGKDKKWPGITLYIAYDDEGLEEDED